MLKVNLPAHCVVLQNTKQYTTSGLKELSESQVLQMIGRAGRPGFDTSGTALILTAASLENKYRNLVSGMRPIESRLVGDGEQKAKSEWQSNTHTAFCQPAPVLAGAFERGDYTQDH